MAKLFLYELKLLYNKSMEKIVINNLSKKYGDIEALHNVSMSVQNGEHIYICGEEGAGISTMLDCISGLTDYSGSIKIGADERRVIKNENIKMSYITNPSTFMRGSVKKNIVFVAKIYGKNLSENDYKNLAEKYHLSLKSSVKKLSDIEKIFLNFARIDVKNSDIVLIDFGKILQNFPPSSQAFCELISWLNNFSGTLIVGENGQNLPPFYTARILNLNFGVLNDDFAIEKELKFPKQIFAFLLAKKLAGEASVIKKFSLQKLQGGFSLTCTSDINLTQADLDIIYEKCDKMERGEEIKISQIDDCFFDSVGGRFLCRISKKNNL